MKEKTVLIDKLAGIRNDLDVERLDVGDLSSGVNIDLDVSGKPRTRLGATKRVAALPKSLWGDGTYGYFLDSGSLKSFLPPSTIATLRSGLSTTRRVVFQQMADIGPVFYTNGEVTGKIQEGVDKPWGIAVPTTPGASVTGGDLRSGRYAYTLTYVRRNGLESGAPVPQTVNVGTDNSGILLADIPVSDDPDVVTKRIYFSGRNGEDVFLVGQIPNAQTTFAYNRDAYGTVPCEKFNKGPMPPGHLLAYNNGFIFVARGPYLIHCDPFSPEQCDLKKGYTPIGADPTIIAPVATGLYVATRDHTVFLQGGSPKEFTMRPVLPYGAPIGNAVPLDGGMVTKDGLQGQVVAWMSSRGWVVGDANGNIINLTQRRYVVPTAGRASSVFKQRNGLTQLVSVLFE